MHTDDRDEGSQELCLGRPHRATSACATCLASTNQAIYFKDLNSRFMLVSRGVVQHHIDRRAQEGLHRGPRPRSRRLRGQDRPGPLRARARPGVDRRGAADHGDGRGHGRRPRAGHHSSTAPGAGTGPARPPCATTTGTSSAPSASPGTSPPRSRPNRSCCAGKPSCGPSWTAPPTPSPATAPSCATRWSTPRPWPSWGCRRTRSWAGPTPSWGARPRWSVPCSRAWQRVLATREMCEVEYATHGEGGTNFWHVRMVPNLAADGAVNGVISATRDLTELKVAQSVLAHQALHDPLTGLLNRLALIDRLNHALADLERNPGRIALLFVDLDNFKLINDARGHEVGDQLLIEVASRLAQVTRRSDTVARLGGDEFVVLPEHVYRQLRRPPARHPGAARPRKALRPQRREVPPDGQHRGGRQHRPGGQRRGPPAGRGRGHVPGQGEGPRPHRNVPPHAARPCQRAPQARLGAAPGRGQRPVLPRVPTVLLLGGPLP